MNAAEASALLGRAASYDNRQPSEAAALAWSEALDAEVSLDDAIAAVIQHYGQTREWLMPADINQRVRAIQRERVRADGTPPIPSGLTYPQEQAWRRAYHAEIRQGTPRPDAERAAHDAIGYRPQPEIDRPVTRAIESQSARWSA